MGGETKVCPVCDSVISAASRRCTECGTDLSLFDVEAEPGPEVGEGRPSRDGKSIDDILESIVGGKGVRPDFFEDMKTEARPKTAAAAEDILADAPPEPDMGVEFECPNCGSRVAGNAKVCPGCGAEFADETVEQFECPICNAVVDVNATTCPKCGVAFARDEPAPAPASSSAGPAPAPPARAAATPASPSGAAATMVVPPPKPSQPPAAVKQAGGPSPMDRLKGLLESRRTPSPPEVFDKAGLYRALPRLVNEVKPLLLTAKKVGVDIGSEKQLISEAINYGKKRDVERAVAIIQRARSQLETAFTLQIGKRIEDTLREVEQARSAGGDVVTIIRLCTEGIDALYVRDYLAAGKKLKSAREEFEARSGGYAKASQELAAVKELVEDARRIGLAPSEVEGFLSRGDAAMSARNYDQAAGFAVQARQTLEKSLPDLLQAEMKKARNALLDMKVKGGDLTKPVGLLKQASIHIKREEYADAARFVRLFHDEVGDA